MGKLESLNDVLKNELKDLFSAEQQLVKALPKVIKKVSAPELKQALTNHLQETEGQVKRLEQIAGILDCKLEGKTCEAMKGLIKECEEAMQEQSEDPALIDALLIGTAQRIEHYEMAGYGTARSMAETLGLSDVAKLLQDTLDEESAADEKLSEVSLTSVLPICPGEISRLAVGNGTARAPFRM